MDKFIVPVFRYRYRSPQGKIPCTYLESTQNILTSLTETGRPLIKIPCREVGGSCENHVQWVSVDNIVPVRDEDGIPFEGKSYVHGVVRHPSWQHPVGDKLWVRTDIPLFEGRKSVPVVNLTQGRSAEVYIRDIDWIPQKRVRGWIPGTPAYLLTIAGPPYPYFSPTLGPNRMAIMIDSVREIHEPLPTYTLPPGFLPTSYYNPYATEEDLASLPPEQREMEAVFDRIDRERHRLDDADDHYTLKRVFLDEIDTKFEDIVDIMQVSVTPTVRGRPRGGPTDRNRERGNLDTRDQLLMSLIATFSGENLGLILAANNGEENDTEEQEIREKE